MSIERCRSAIPGHDRARGQTDIGGAFNGSIAKLIAAGAKIKAIVGYYGSDAITNQGLYVLPGSPVHTARDLIGKKVAVNTLGTVASRRSRRLAWSGPAHLTGRVTASGDT